MAAETSLSMMFRKQIWFGKKHTEETRRTIGEKNSVSQLGKRNSQYGKCWIHNDKESIRIKKEDLDKYILLGWIKGRIQGECYKTKGKNNCNYGKQWIHNDKKSILIIKEELSKYLNIGWIKGRKLKF